MWDVDSPQRGETRQHRDGNVQPHFQKHGIERKASADFTTAVLNSLEVPETLHCCSLCVIWLHSALDVCFSPHFNMEFQFRLDFTGNFIRMPARVNETSCGFDPRHDKRPPQTARSAFIVALASRSQFC